MPSQLQVGWMTVCGWVNHLRKSTTQLNSAFHPSVVVKLSSGLLG